MKIIRILLVFFLLSAISFPSFSQKKKVKIKTPYGKMVFRLYDATPQHRDNFIKLIKARYYDGLLFHRVIDSFMVQGGDPQSRQAQKGIGLGGGGPEYKIPAEIEADLFHKKGALAAAREGDFVNPEKASSGSQFYIVEGKTYNDKELDEISERTGHQFTSEQRSAYKTIGGTPFLDGHYTVFGYMIKGEKVLDVLSHVKTDTQDRPIDDIPMKVR